MRYVINRVNADTVITFASQELKKYLRMLMPRCGDIKINYAPDSKDGFRLGLMSDFGLEPDVDDIYLDDVIYVETDEKGGIIAGSNPRSVLQAVYRFLKKQGCNWLFPGPDGEVIPLIEGLTPVSYQHKASMRYRGQCNEGAETQPTMMDAIDFTPKVGLNTFMIEFDIPKAYYATAYAHKFGVPEAEAPLSNEQILRWKRECEVEMAKRGLLFHDMGHGWTAEPFGFDSTDGWKSKEVTDLTDEQKEVLPLLDGVRQFYKGVALNTNFCMSNEKARRTVAKYIADYSEAQNNVDFMHVWLADASNNHCECENCQKKVTSDWYIMLLNEIDEELTKKNLSTHIVFIAYVDTLWAPTCETIKNTKRFTMLFAPITRLYTETYQVEPDDSKIMPYIRNELVMPKGMAENLAYLNEWQKMWKGDIFCYEYHFWQAQYKDIGSMYLAKIIYDDIQGLAKNGLSGIVEDGSQRSYFPTGFQFFVYGETLYDTGRTFESLKEEYFSAAFGEDWQLALDYLERLSAASDFGYCKGERPKTERGHYYAPELREMFEKLPQIADEFLPVIEAHRTSDNRNHYVSWDLLKWHTKFVKGFASSFAATCVGDDDAAVKSFFKLVKDMGPLELLRPCCYDHELAMRIISRAVDPQRRVTSDEILSE
ncbi:MAG: DUF4838 domain-containing protein [Clostridia bacterium]|nr:DUF4838 domain-containing protein [Clostridia bacterium]